MTGELTTIKSAYEDSGMSPEQIAEDRDLDLVAVKAALAQCSSRYRKDCGIEEKESGESDPTLDFSDDDLRRINDVLLNMALGADDEHLRFKAAQYIRNDKKGRLEPKKQLAGNNFNVLMINQQLQKARGAASAIINSVVGSKENKLINV